MFGSRFSSLVEMTLDRIVAVAAIDMQRVI